jgi:hypothetical protein
LIIPIAPAQIKEEEKVFKKLHNHSGPLIS